MKRYGYLGKPSSSESLVTEDAVINGLMKLQTFARLPATGKIDAATIKVLNKTISKVEKICEYSLDLIPTPSLKV